MKFTVDRKTWFRGKGSFSNVGMSCLLREDGKRCCIGFVGQQCGVQDSILLNVVAVRNSLGVDAFPKWMQYGRYANYSSTEQSDIYRAYAVNDNADMTDEEREVRLKDIFLRNGDEIEFIN